MEKFSNKHLACIPWAKTIVGMTNQTANKDREEKKRKEKCRGWDLNPRTPKGRDFLRKILSP
ncbi:MAG: hypothetical protein ACREA1_05985, partial [Nitrosotalea sp.]